MSDDVEYACPRCFEAPLGRVVDTGKLYCYRCNWKEGQMRRTHHMMLMLERFFRWLSRWAQDMEWKCAFCPDCRRNRYTGAPCKNVEEAE